MLEASRFCHMVEKTLKYLHQECNLKLPCAIYENTTPMNEERIWGKENPREVHCIFPFSSEQ